MAEEEGSFGRRLVPSCEMEVKQSCGVLQPRPGSEVVTRGTRRSGGEGRDITDLSDANRLAISSQAVAACCSFHIQQIHNFLREHMHANVPPHVLSDIAPS